MDLGLHRDCTCLVRRTSELAVRNLDLGLVVHHLPYGLGTCWEQLVHTAGLAVACRHAASGQNQEVPLPVAAEVAEVGTESAEWLQRTGCRHWCLVF